MPEPIAGEVFDPYYKWLGISPKDQPPHHYRLLAIDVFESDPDVIAAAADKQMTFIRSFQAGQNSQLSQRILNEIAAARICLLNAAKKNEYDRGLRARLAAAAASSGIKRANPLPAVAAAEQVIVLAEDATFSPPPMPLGGSKRASPHRGKKTKKATFLPLAILGGLLAIAAGAVAVVMSHQPELQESRADSAPDQNPGAGRETSPSKSSANESKPVPTGSVKPAATGDGTASAATSGSLSKAGDLPRTSADAPDRRPRGNAESSSNAAPDVGDDPATRHAGLSAKPKTSAAAPAANPEAAVQTVSAAKSKTPEELDKQLADAKTDEEYRAVVVDALRAADKSTDDGQPAAARQLVLKALVAARKSGDSKLVYGVTRALTIPDSLKKTLAELKSE